jgi:hypothetical protein
MVTSASNTVRSTVSKLAQSAHIYVLECVKARQSVFMSSKRVCVTRFGMPSALCAFATGVWLRSNAGMHNRTPGYAAGHRFTVRGSLVRRTTVPARLSYHTIAIVYCNDCVLHDAIVVVVTMGEYCKMLQCCICFGLGPGILASPDALDLAFFDQSNDLTFDRSISAPYSIFLL